LIAHEELVEIIATPGDGAVGVADLDGVTTTKRHDKCPSDFQVLLHIAEPASSNGLPPTREVGEIQRNPEPGAETLNEIGLPGENGLQAPAATWA